MLSAIRLVYSLLTPSERRRGVGVLLVMFVAALFQVGGVGLIHPFLTVLTDPSTIQENALLSRAFDLSGLSSTKAFTIALGVGVVVVIILSNLVLGLSAWLNVRFYWDVHHSLSNRLMESYLSRPFSFYLTANTSELNKNVLSEAEQLSNGVVNPTLQFISKGMMLLSLLGLLLFINWAATFVLLGVIGGLYAAVYLKLRAKMQTLGIEYVEANRKRFQAAQEAFNGIRELKVLGLERGFLAEYERESATYSARRAAHQVYMQLPRYLLEILAFSGLVLIMIGYLVADASVTSVIPIMGLFAFAGYRMMPAFRDILAAATTYEFHDDLMQRIQADLEQGSLDSRDVHEDGGSLPGSTSGIEIKVENVSYTYPESEEPAIAGLDFRIRAGQKVAFVGRTGAGKSTLLNMLLGLTKPSEGTIMVDGRDLRKIPRAKWQADIGYVPQDIFLKDDTVAHNIALGVPPGDVDLGAVRSAATVAQIHDFIEEQLPEGYDTVIGEDGVRLSGGQRQRLGIARAMYRDPAFLVLDEPTSDIDGLTEAKLTQAIAEAAAGRTVVIVAHRLNTLRQCDRIYVLREGRIVAEGRFRELMERSDEFQAMVRAGQYVAEA